ncbi:DMT family transporter [Agrobacterium vitis]|uniref:EamA family transporter n=1 Tax=Agrobacterium vitis TaxID=373 RepID=A0AAE4WCZ2_AGRVI|nr:DMT family transporter [Agrobacterium vitis]MCF1501965.1 DMT family transporter [Allorhizobium sp. Av2]MCM2443442.1 DMT family transporter [Agrobacterium vitis]MUZ58617.1 EamA family transporter [Agrobacterium vitis]MVA65690.1 EamA family transporter [Agrobacterium vitis]MVA88289.1 EamA family transporter [Agrobacterium vitis]
MSAPSTTDAKSMAASTLLLFLACVAIWSTNWIAITTQIVETPAVVSLFWRFLLAFVTLTIVDMVKRPSGERMPAPLLLCGLVGTVYYFAGIGLTYLATRYLPSSYVACLSISVIFFAMALKRIFQGVRIRTSNLMGAVVASFGVALFFLGGEGRASNVWLGLGLALLSFLAVAAGSVLSEHIQKTHKLSSVRINRIAIGFACALYLVVALAQGASLAVPLSLSYLLPLAYLGIVCSALVFVMYIALVGRIGAEYAGYIGFIYPLIATYISFAFGETDISAAMIGGSLLVVVGCVIGLRFETLFRRKTASARSSG